MIAYLIELFTKWRKKVLADKSKQDCLKASLAEHEFIARVEAHRLIQQHEVNSWAHKEAVKLFNKMVEKEAMGKPYVLIKPVYPKIVYTSAFDDMCLPDPQQILEEKFEELKAQYTNNASLKALNSPLNPQEITDVRAG